MLNSILVYKYSTNQDSPKTAKMIRKMRIVIMVMITMGWRKNGHRSCSVSSISGSPTPPQCRFSKSSTYGSRDINLTFLLHTDIRSDEDILCAWNSSIWPSLHSNIMKIILLVQFSTGENYDNHYWNITNLPRWHMEKVYEGKNIAVTFPRVVTQTEVHIGPV